MARGTARHAKAGRVYPNFSRPRPFLPDWLAANRQNMPFYAGGRLSSSSRLELFSLATPSSSPLGNLQTAFALLSLAASVVNKKNRKTDAATECHQTCLNGRGARRNRVAFREQRPFTGYAEVARGSRRQREAKLSTDADASSSCRRPCLLRGKIILE